MAAFHLVTERLECALNRGARMRQAKDCHVWCSGTRPESNEYLSGWVQVHQDEFVDVFGHRASLSCFMTAQVCVCVCVCVCVFSI